MLRKCNFFNSINFFAIASKLDISICTGFLGLRKLYYNWTPTLEKASVLIGICIVMQARGKRRRRSARCNITSSSSSSKNIWTLATDLPGYSSITTRHLRCHDWSATGHADDVHWCAVSGDGVRAQIPFCRDTQHSSSSSSSKTSAVQL